MLHPLDDTDVGILRLLQQNGRFTLKELGEKLNKSTSSINDRIKRIQDDGYIRGYGVQIDHLKVGLALICFTHVKIKDHLHEDVSRFAREIIKHEQVLECFKVSGEFDFMLRIASKDTAAYHDFLDQVVSKLVPLANLQSTFVLQEVKTGTVLPIGQAKFQEV
ncbi:Lrp/AsnC family transcriptional regulator [Mucilaginibacter agri]|uniref:Winged helix-turn-helix transcriptional regulator n=1 Tax=Mucilaginibacter agri TaxID=2695265 RepID=A0A966DRA0_9SPHI|nr:Lrp/AsnC family transcriptional regulator [Mucilaginibacter agri]NCD68275.1 winged helix-turn-helix transcriptional regulator [Mucilaginibacter agri]